MLWFLLSEVFELQNEQQCSAMRISRRPVRISAGRLCCIFLLVQRGTGDSHGNALTARPVFAYGAFEQFGIDVLGARTRALPVGEPAVPA